MSGGGGAERMARRMLDKAQKMVVPRLPDLDVEPIPRAEFARAAGFEPDPWQEAVLGSEERKFLLLCSLQSGKSTTATRGYSAAALVVD